MTAVSFAQNVRFEFHQSQIDYLAKQRSLKEKLNPSTNPYQFDTEKDVWIFLDQLSTERYTYVYDKFNESVTVYDNKNANEIVAMIPMTTRADLLSYKPSRLKTRLAQMSQDIYLAGKSGVKHTALNLPMEASVFYLALGSVAAFNIFSNAGQNPAGLKMFNDQQASAVGITSLFMFLGTQNATSNIAQLFIKNPKWHIMIPYLSMTVGSMVQNYYTSIASDPNIKACLNEMFGMQLKADGAGENPCDKSYEYFTLQKPWEFAPALTSMIISTAISTSAQYVISTATLAAEKRITEKVIANQAKRNLVKMGMLRFAGFLNPGAVPFLAVSGSWIYFTKYSNLSMFALLDHKMMHGITFAVKNLQESYSLPFVNSLKKTSDTLVQNIAYQKSVGWAGDKIPDKCSEFKSGDCSGFYEGLLKFKDQMRVWRMANIAEVNEAHTSWQTYLGDLVSRYLATKEFYQRFISEAKKYVTDPAKPNMLDRVYPLWGIKTEKTKHFDETYYTDPHLPESEQLDPAMKFKNQILDLFHERLVRTRVKSGPDAEFFEKLLTYFKDNLGGSVADKMRMGQGIDLVKRWYESENTKGRTKYSDYQAVGQYLKELGNPEPSFEPGAGFINAISRSPQINQFYKSIDLSRDNSITQSRSYKTYSDVIVNQMVCGVDVNKNEKFIDETWGFRSHFTGPRITDLVDQGKTMGRFCDNRFPIPIMKSQLGGPFVGPNRHTKLATYSTGFEFLKYNLKPELYDVDFKIWWEKNVDPQMSEAFAGFQDKYVDNIAKLVEKLNRVDNSSWNRGETGANGLTINVFQELRVYLLILGEILKDSPIAMQSKELLRYEVNPIVTPNLAIQLTGAESVVKIPEIVKYQSRGSFLDFNDILRQLRLENKSVVSNGIYVRFNFQDEMERLFAELNGLLRQISVSKVGEKTTINGNLSNSDFDTVITKIEKLNVRIAEQFGVPVKQEDQLAALLEQAGLLNPSVGAPKLNDLKLSVGTRKIVVRVLEMIQELSYEMKTYGMIINAVNWKALNQLNNTSKEADRIRQDKINQIINQTNKAHKVGG